MQTAPTIPRPSAGVHTESRAAPRISPDPTTTTPPDPRPTRGLAERSRRSQTSPQATRCSGLIPEVKRPAFVRHPIHPSPLPNAKRTGATTCRDANEKANGTSERPPHSLTHSLRRRRFAAPWLDFMAIGAALASDPVAAASWSAAVLSRFVGSSPDLFGGPLLLGIGAPTRKAPEDWAHSKTLPRAWRFFLWRANEDDL